MNRAMMDKQITEVPMKKKPKGYMNGSKVKAGSKKRGYAGGGQIDQTQCSLRKQMAMRGRG